MAAKKTTTKKTAARGKTARRPPEPEQALSRAAWGAIWGIAGLLCLLAILPIDGALLDWLHSGVGALVGRGGYVLPFALFALAGLLFVRGKRAGSSARDVYCAVAGLYRRYHPCTDLRQ